MKAFLITIVTLANFLCFGQAYINPGVDTTDQEVKLALKFYNNYLSEFKDTSLPDFKDYWSKEDCEKYKCPDQILYAIAAKYPTYRMGVPTIIYVKPTSDYIQIKTHFGWTDSLDHISTLCITNHYVKLTSDGKTFFINPVELNSKDWQRKKVGSITYHFPPDHKFDSDKAESLLRQVKTLQKEWNVKPIDIDYYFADTEEDIKKLRGFDYTLTMGNKDRPTGMSDDKDNIIYCSGLGEDYFHEVVHMYLNRLFPDSPLKEGLATFYGGSMGHVLNWHIDRLGAYLKKHPEIDLSELSEFTYMDNYTNPKSAIQGIFCAEAYKKDGINGLKRIIKYTSLDDLILKEYGVEKYEWDEFLRQKIYNWK